MHNVKNSYDEIFKKISKEYDNNIIKHGNSPKSVGQLDIRTLAMVCFWPINNTHHVSINLCWQKLWIVI